jgi:hypothetical protein
MCRDLLALSIDHTHLPPALARGQLDHSFSRPDTATGIKTALQLVRESIVLMLVDKQDQKLGILQEKIEKSAWKRLVPVILLYLMHEDAWVAQLQVRCLLLLRSSVLDSSEATLTSGSAQHAHAGDCTTVHESKRYRQLQVPQVKVQVYLCTARFSAEFRPELLY